MNFSFSAEPYATVYGAYPWLILEDTPVLKAFMRAHGKPFSVEKGERISFCTESSVFHIERGLIATFPLLCGGQAIAGGLFGSGSTLGLVRAIGHRGARLNLEAYAYTAATGREVRICELTDWLAEGGCELGQSVLRNCIAKSECQVEGLLLNSILPVPMRLLKLIDILFVASVIEATNVSHPGGRKIDQVALEPAVGFVPLPWCLTVAELAMILHAAREMVSRAITDWIHAGVMKRSGRKLFVDRERLHGVLASFEAQNL